MYQAVRKLIQEDAGQDMLEYTLIAALVALGSIVAFKALGNAIGSTFTGVNTSLTSATS
jgi:pilus assembly protein Flp/PilA